MPELRRIEKEDAVEAFKRFSQRGGGFPDFLFDKEEYCGVALGLFEGERQIGLFMGVLVTGDPTLYFHHLSLDDGCEPDKTTYLFLKKVFCWVQDNHDVERTIINIEQDKPEEPLFTALLRTLDFAELTQMVFMRQVCMKTEDFVYLREYRWYRPHLIHKKGYDIIPWKDYDEAEINKLLEAEKQGMTEDGYLSPDVWKDEWEYDKDTSFVLVRKGTTAPLGWIITERMNAPSAVRVRRYYIYKGIRDKLMGPAFATWVLDKIAERYEEMYYELEPDNDQMYRFADKYCTSHQSVNYYRCSIEMKLK